MPHPDSAREREELEGKIGLSLLQPHPKSTITGETVHREQQSLHQESIGSPQLEESEVNTGTPPRCPRKAYAQHREQSVNELLISARKVFGSRLHPQGGGLTPLDYPVKKRSFRMENSLKWNPESYDQIPTSLGAAAASIPAMVDKGANEGREKKEKDQEVRSPVVSRCRIERSHIISKHVLVVEIQSQSTRTLP